MPSNPGIRYDVQNAGARAPEAAPVATSSSQSLLNTAKDTFSNRTALYALLASALGSGAIGGLLTARSPKRQDETPGQRRLRILRNALGTGAAGAGVAGAGLLAKNLLEQSPVVPGAATATDQAVHDPATRLGLAGLGGIIGNRLGARSETKELADEVVRAWNPYRRSSQNGPATVDDIRNAMRTVGKTPANALASQTAMRDMLTQKLQVTPEGANNILRSIGTVPPGESALEAWWLRNFSRQHGASNRGVMGSLSGSKGTNRRLLGGAIGAGAGMAVPPLWDLGWSIADKVKDKANEPLF